MNSDHANRTRSTVSILFIVLGLVTLALWGGKPFRTAAQPPTDNDMVIYDGGLKGDWQDWSWAEHNLADQTSLYQSKPTARLVPTEFKALYFHTPTLALKNFTALTLAISGAGTGGQKLTLCVTDTRDKFGKKLDLADYLPGKRILAGKFVTATVPLSLFGVDSINGICIQDATGKPQAPVYLGDIRFVRQKQKPQIIEVAMEVDANKELGEISPYIYGIAHHTPEHFSELKTPLSRWGGNATTRYNWELGNAWNSARDWSFRNGNYGAAAPEYHRPSSVADKTINEVKAAGADTLLTIPTMGWVARNDDQSVESKGVPSGGGDAITLGASAIPGYDPTANRKRVSIQSLPRKGKPFSDPPDLTDDVVYQDEWVSHLTKRYGKADAGGVKFYAMDNEPDLWDSTHTDMHPVRMGYQDILERFLASATSVKDVDSTAQILGPVSWGWTGYFFSAKDRGKDNFATHADRKAHGDMPFLAWFLQEVSRKDKTGGRRTLDFLDIHYYPQGAGLYEGKTGADTNALRLRSTRSLWDETYSDESWIGTNIQLIPRMRQWIQKHYPGTKLAITEWNWGADTHINGGLAIAEVLGIFARERVDMACYWTSPPIGSPGFLAYKMYRNADGKGHGFGDTALYAGSSDAGRISVFASLDKKTGHTTVMLINKTVADTGKITLHLKSKTRLSSAEVYRYSEEVPKIVPLLPAKEIQNGKLQITLPPYSITLLRCK
ncbi:MAG: hypothetical protein NT023_11580 [Armatimonadetes bacterium]|nr:hypothetical protein [Armatimonadota bacterium]